MKEINQLTRIIEALLFSVDRPMSVDRMLEIFDENERPEKQQILEVLEILKNDYLDRSIELKEVASGFQFQTRQELAPWVAKLFEEKAPRYSRALLETLILIAYRQPITRGEIEDIRGVAVNSNIIKTLQEREWIRSVGFRDVPGKPELLATTKEFLDYFGLKSLSDLPPLSELQDLDKMAEKLEQNLVEENNEQVSEEASVEENSTDASESLEQGSESNQEEQNQYEVEETEAEESSEEPSAEEWAEDIGDEKSESEEFNHDESQESEELSENEVEVALEDDSAKE